jgi:hypothetical protein
LYLFSMYLAVVHFTSWIFVSYSLGVYSLKEFLAAHGFCIGFTVKFSPYALESSLFLYVKFAEIT